MTGFVLPPYPYDRLDGLARDARERHGSIVDLSIGTPFDPPAPAVVRALAESDSERGYPPSVGSAPLLDAARAWIERRFGVTVARSQVAACVGTKEFVASTPLYLRLRSPERDTVLYPAVSYPTYAMGATFAGCRSVAVPPDTHGAPDLTQVDPDDVARALMLWVNSPSNPTGALTDLAAVGEWGRAHGVPVFSDECYVEFTWDGPGRTILSNDARGLDGVVAVHSLSKRSNLAGLRVGFYAGDAELVHYLSECRKHAGLMVPGPAQAAAAVALGDDVHVEAQRARYEHRLRTTAEVISQWSSVEVPMPRGGFYLWFDAGDGWDFVRRFADEGGALASPGAFYGTHGERFVRVAVVQPDEAIELIGRRLGVR